MDASPVSSREISREEIGELIVELRELERRVSALEQAAPKPHLEALPAAAVPDLHVSGDVAPSIGRALLAVAGAYLLRALTELHTIPEAAGVAAGIVYAGFWLWHATRVKTRLAATVNTLSAVFIFLPLIWEATVRLHAVPDWAAAVVIATFALAGATMPWVGVWSCAAGAAISLGLLVATQDLVPFAGAALAIAAGAELAQTGTRWFAALCADAAMLALILLLGRSGGLPEGYAAVSMPLALALLGILFATGLGAALWRTIFRRRLFTAYEIGQTVCAFALAAGGVLYLTGAATAVGVFSAAMGGMCYAIAMRWSGPRRNVQAYAAFGMLLTGSAIFLLLRGEVRIAAWSALAIGLAWTAFGNFQVPALLWSAAAVSGVASGTASRLFTGAGEAFPHRAATVILMAAIVSYLRISRSGGPWPGLLIAAAVVWCVSGSAAAMGAGAGVLMMMAILAAWIGRRWQRRELIWLMYALMTLAGFKILFRDFSRESTLTLVVSLIFYGATLILLPKLLRKT